MTKHRPPGAFYSSAGGDVIEDKGDNFNHASLLVVETFSYGLDWSGQRIKVPLVLLFLLL